MSWMNHGLDEFDRKGMSSLDLRYDIRRCSFAARRRAFTAIVGGQP